MNIDGVVLCGGDDADIKLETFVILYKNRNRSILNVLHGLLNLLADYTRHLVHLHFFTVIYLLCPVPLQLLPQFFNFLNVLHFIRFIPVLTQHQHKFL